MLWRFFALKIRVMQRIYTHKIRMQVKGAKLHFKSAETRQILCVGVVSDRTHAAHFRGAGNALIDHLATGGMPVVLECTQNLQRIREKYSANT